MTVKCCTPLVPGQDFSNHIPAAHTKQTLMGALVVVEWGSDKKWLWSEKKISVSSGSLCPPRQDDEALLPPAKEAAVTVVGRAARGREGWRRGACHSRPTTPRRAEKQGVGEGVGKDNPNKHLEDILPGTPKLITVPRWH